MEIPWKSGLARCADVAFPRRLRRLDVAPVATTNELAMAGLAAELQLGQPGGGGLGHQNLGSSRDFGRI